MRSIARALIALALLAALLVAVPTATAYPHQPLLMAGAGYAPNSQLPTTNIFILAILALISGLLSFLSPCTLPILPAYFAFTFQAGRRQITAMTVAFFVGLSTIFVLLGASASLIGDFLNTYIRELTTIGGLVIMAFGVMTFLGKGFTGLQLSNQPAATLGGSLLFGATFALGWTSCIGPILASLLVLAAANQTVLEGAILLFIYAMGLGLPLILVSTLFGRMDRDSVVWRFLRGKGWEVSVGGWSFHLHTTSLVSGLLFIGLGVMMITGYLTFFNRFIPTELQVWFLGLEERLITLVQGR
ncbi:MAG: cytochrome c biogenesis CcdA family protein [Anaerolineae bacterium]